MSRFADLMRARTAHAAGIAGAFVITGFLAGIRVIPETGRGPYILATAEHFTAWFLMAVTAAAIISACEVLMHPNARRIAVQATLLVASTFLLARFVTTSDLLTIQYRAMGMEVDASLFLYGLWLGWAFSALMSWYYWASETALRAATALRGAEIARQRAQQRLLESRLRVLEAQVEPRFLLDTLSHLQQMYEHDADDADRALDELIDYLRARMLAAAQPRNEAIATH